MSDLIVTMGIAMTVVLVVGLAVDRLGAWWERSADERVDACTHRCDVCRGADE